MSPDMQVETTVGHLVMEDPTIHTLTDVNLKHFIGVIDLYNTDTVYMYIPSAILKKDKSANIANCNRLSLAIPNVIYI